jgi:predicted amidohydrolase
MRQWAAVVFLFAALAVPAAEFRGSEPFTTVAVQFEISEELFGRSADPLAFFADHVEQIVAAAVETHNADLVVFPEYLNALALAAPDLERILAADTVDQAITSLMERYGAESVPALLAARSSEVNPELVAIWRRIARRYRVAIIPGTFFWSRSGSEVTTSSQITNRLIVIGGNGELLHQQDKVYLTPEEEALFELTPGAVSDAQPFYIGGRRIVATICRDSYFDRWERHFAPPDIWIDLRANGEPYTFRVRERFDGALPERVANTEAEVGINATLTGSFLDLFWEGPSYTVDASGRRIAESPEPDATSLVITSLYRSGLEPATTVQSWP